MGRKIIKKILALICVCVIALTSAKHTFAYSIYDGTISSTYLTYFEGILSKSSIDDDYLILRSGQNEYVMVVGDLTYNNRNFVGSSLIEYKFYTETNNYNSQNRFDVNENVSINQNVNNYIVYSNLGPYPDIIERSSYYEMSLLIAFVIFGICMLMRPIFKYTYRKG